GPGAGTLRRADSAGLEQALLCALENPRDGYLDGLLRRLSRPLTRLLLHTPVTPNAVTVIGVASRVAGGLLLGVPGVAAAGAWRGGRTGSSTGCSRRSPRATGTSSPSSSRSPDASTSSCRPPRSGRICSG